MLPKKILDELLEFRHERDWEKFHTAKNLSASISIEAAELQEHFQWARDSDVNDIINRDKASIENEVADIVILLSYFCHDMDIDISNAVKRKLDMNRKKYPIEKSRGVSTKYDRL